LKQNIEYVRASLADLGMLGRSIGSEGPICAIPVKPGRAVAAGEKLIEMGLLLTPIRFPSVPEGSAMLRVSIMRGHTREMMDELFSALGELKVEGYMPDAE
jgi:7-keto-8-aminopelargonate synthetase-like enzyme